MTLEEALAESAASLTGGCAGTEDVAARLKDAHCEGQRGDPLQCPLARWYGAALRERGLLRRRLAVAVDGTTWGRAYLYVHVQRGSGRGAAACRPVPVPELAVRFASAFDSGGFPELSA